ncbi:MAG: autotransporter outer membrane beta-barrel domain-containing protein, partial [Schwartzia sp.]|nr:autotransporter outer membrane beta-barrel domain-containing protein [Schwartzia sp. (in: firmicutes)]
GTADGGTIAGTQTVKANATAQNMTVAENATQTVSGTAQNMTVNGTQTVEAGGTADGGTIAGTQTVKANATAQNMTVAAGATQTVSGTAQNMAVNGIQTVEAGGIAEGGTIYKAQTIEAGGTANGMTVAENATQTVSGTAQNMAVNGTQTIEAGGIATGTTTIDGGTQNVSANATVESVVLTNGVQNLGGTATGTTTINGGTQNVNGTLQGATTIESGVQNVSGTATGMTTINNGTQNVNAGAKVTDVTINGGVQNLHGEATSTTTINGGTQNVNAGATVAAAAISGGVQNIAAGATVENTALTNGTQNVSGTADATTIHGGEQHVYGGGTATDIVMNGGTLTVEDGGSAQVTTATAGFLKLLEVGLAEVSLEGGLSYTFTDAYARGDTVRLRTAADTTTVTDAARKTLAIANSMDGYADFYINTDLANNQSDLIQYPATITNATQPNTIRINYDPTLATGTTVATTDTTVATVGTANAATFTGAASVIGGFNFTPTVTSDDNGLTWKIKSTALAGPSEQMLAGVNDATGLVTGWRDTDFAMTGHMASLHRDPQRTHANDFWVDFTRGRRSVSGNGRDRNSTCNRVTVGYDRYTAKGWTVGLSYGYESGSDGYRNGSGSSKADVVTAYTTWENERGDYLDMAVKGGHLRSDFTVQGEGQAQPSKGDHSTYGYGVSAIYGHRFENAKAFYVEPHAGFYWTHINGYDYNMSDGSAVSVDGSNSFVGNIGVNIGQKLGNGDVYLRADFMHDFSGHTRLSMTKGTLTNTMEESLHDNWLNVAIGYRQDFERVGWYAEAGSQGIGGRGTSGGDWIWKAGVEFKF